MMDGKLYDEWVKALETKELNGKRISQAQGTLHKNKTNAYCCLGVLCRVGGLSNVEIRNLGMISDLEPEDVNLDDYDEVTGKFKTILKKAAPIIKMLTKQLTKKQENKLVELNDDAVASFYVIAQWIRKNVNRRPTKEESCNAT